MLDYNKYLMRYGEFGVQAIIENIEHRQGIHHNISVTLEQRWYEVMQNNQDQDASLAA
jgi:hypothetical protein